MAVRASEQRQARLATAAQPGEATANLPEVAAVSERTSDELEPEVKPAPGDDDNEAELDALAPGEAVDHGDVDEDTFYDDAMRRLS